MGNWDLLWYGLSILAVIGIISLLFSDKVNQVMEKVEYFASGHITEHHKYQPFD